MRNLSVWNVEKILKKKFPFGFWFYNPYLKQHVLLGDGGAHFCDKDFNLLFKEPKLRYMETAQFVDDDLCVFVKTSSSSVIIYSIQKKEIIYRVSLRIPKKYGEGKTCEVNCAFYCKKTNSLIFNVWYDHVYTTEWRASKHGIFAYDITNKKYTEIVPDGVNTDECFDYKDTYAFYVSHSLLSEGKACTIGFDLYVVDSNLSVKKVQLDTKHLAGKTMDFDEERGLMVFHDKEDIFDGYMYYGDGTEFTAIDLDGNEQPWKPLRRYQKKLQTVKRSEIDFEDYIDKNGIDEYVAKNLSEEELEGTAEELLQSGYNWALNKIEQKAKTAGAELYDFLGNEQIAEVEGILYSVGWLQAEIENGGIEQYFSNGDKKEFDLLINALTAVGAVETAGVIKKGARMVANFNKKENPELYERDKYYERLEKLRDDLTEDYAVLTIKYLVGKAQ